MKDPLPLVPRKALFTGALLVLAALAFGSCAPDSSSAPGAASRSQPAEDLPRDEPAAPDFNVALIVLDACRADKMGFYGFERPTTPELDTLARDPDALAFRNYRVQSSWTRPSTASLFTGLYVHQHGMRSSHEKKKQDDKTRPIYQTDLLPDEHRTLAERMQELGYRTFAIVKGENLNPRYGYGQGFDEFVTRSDVREDPERVGQFLLLARKAPGRFFGYLHLVACHNAYPEAERDADYMQRFGFPYDEAARREAGVDFSGQETKEAIRKGRVKLLPEDVRFLHLIYEAKLRLADRTLVRPLLDGLRRSGLYDNTLILVTADHGEELYDHEGYAHGHAVWEELLHVPFLVKFPQGRRPAALDATGLVRAIDVLPSVLDLAGAPVPEGLPGVPVFRGQHGDVSISEGRENWAYLAGEYKLIIDANASRLFHLPSDPGEKNDLAAQEPERVQGMRASFQAMVGSGANAPEVEVELTPEQEANLRALGYIR